MRPRELAGLYLVVDGGAPPRDLLPALEGALAGGVDLVQLWGAGRHGGDALEIGGKVQDLCSARGVPLLVADDVDLAAALGAGGVHLDGYSVPERSPASVRERVGPHAIVGVTCGASRDKLAWAKTAGPDYVSFCSMFPTTSVDTCDIVPLPMIGEAKRTLGLPVFASGGITPDNVARVVEAGADGVAVISAVLGADDPRRAAQELKGAVAAAAMKRERNWRTSV